MSLKRYEAWKSSKIEESSRRTISRRPSRVNESWKPLTDIDQIEAWLIKMGIENYSINKDGSVDVDGQVDISDRGLKEIPIQFETVARRFYCYNNNLTSLNGAPREVGGDFICSGNELTSLEGAPKKVTGQFFCDNNQLTSLEGAPKEIKKDFDISTNRLTSLKNAPSKIGGNFDVSYNELTSLDGVPAKINGDLDVSFNQLTREYIFGDKCPSFTCKYLNVKGNYEIDNPSPKNITCKEIIEK